jgi:hypothetical protein
MATKPFRRDVDEPIGFRVCKNCFQIKMSTAFKQKSKVCRECKS